MCVKRDRNRALALCFVASLSPLGRLLPGSALRASGSWAFFITVLALPVSWALGGAAGRVCSRRGGKMPPALALPLALWLCFYAGVISRAAAERLCQAVYPETKPYIFIIVIALAVLVTLRGRQVSLYRAARLVLPFLASAMAFIFLFNLAKVSPGWLLPREEFSPGVLWGLVPVIAPSGLWLAEAALRGDGEEVRRPGLRSLLTAALGCAMTFLTVGALSPGMAAQVRDPAMTLVRDMEVLGSDTRVDALAVAVWIVTDFAALALLAALARRDLGLALPRLRGPGPDLFCALGPMAVGCLFAGAPEFALGPAPLINAGVCYVYLPLGVLFGGKNEET